MSKVSFVGASADDRAALLGEGFRHIEVLDFEVVDNSALFMVRIAISGSVVTLVGDPQEALRTYLAGTQGETAQ